MFFRDRNKRFLDLPLEAYARGLLVNPVGPLKKNGHAFRQSRKYLSLSFGQGVTCCLDSLLRRFGWSFWLQTYWPRAVVLPSDKS